MLKCNTSNTSNTETEVRNRQDLLIVITLAMVRTVSDQRRCSSSCLLVPTLAKEPSQFIRNYFSKHQDVEFFLSCVPLSVDFQHQMENCSSSGHVQCHPAAFGFFNLLQDVPYLAPLGLDISKQRHQKVLVPASLFSVSQGQPWSE